MCVIAICRTVRLTDIQVEQMYDANSSGGGAAWRELDEDGVTTIVAWSKGLKKEEMVEINKTLPFPYILHFRKPSNGTSQSLLACHPFVIEDEAGYYYDGKTQNRVLFHNGFWTGWEDKLQQLALNGGGLIKIPDGPWSDSRGLALAAAYLGHGFLTFTREKIATMGPGEGELQAYGAWEHIENPDAEGKPQKILVSNKTWERSTYKAPERPTIPMQLASRRGQPGGADVEGTATFPDRSRQVRSSIGGEQDRKEEVQEGVEGSQFETPQGNSFSVVAAIKKKCNGCPKTTEKGTVFNDLWYCWHCWSDRTQNRQPTKFEPLVGKCHICTHSYGASKQLSNDKWICRTCWEVNGKPPMYYVTAKTTLQPVGSNYD